MAHNTGPLAARIEAFHRQFPQFSKPKACVIIRVPGESGELLKTEYEAAGIPVSVMTPSTLSESALVAQSIREAIKGPLATIEEIMNTDLLELPKWYYTT
jgi:hypothetical protein